MKRKNNEQSILQWWWNTKLDSNDREMFNYIWLLMGAPLFLVAVAANGNILFVILLTVWSARVLLVGSRAISRKFTELTDEHQAHMDMVSIKNDDTEDFFLEEHEEVDREPSKTQHTIG